MWILELWVSIWVIFLFSPHWNSLTCVDLLSKSRWPCCHSQWSQSSRSWTTSKEGEWKCWPPCWAKVLASWICIVKHTKKKTTIQVFASVVWQSLGCPTRTLIFLISTLWNQSYLSVPAADANPPWPQLSWMTCHTALRTVSGQACLGGRLIPASFSAVPSRQAGCHWTYRLLHSGQMWPFRLTGCWWTEQ